MGYFEVKYRQMFCESADRQYHLERFSPALYLGLICLIQHPFYVKNMHFFHEREGGKLPCDPPDNLFLVVTFFTIRDHSSLDHCKRAEGKLMQNYGYKMKSMSILNKNSFLECKPSALMLLRVNKPCQIQTKITKTMISPKETHILYILKLREL